MGRALVPLQAAAGVRTKQELLSSLALVLIGGEYEQKRALTMVVHRFNPTTQEAGVGRSL